METETLAPANDPRAQVKQIVTTMKAVVDEYGRDYVYHRRINALGQAVCWYVNATGDGPDCLAGHVLHRLGVSLEQLRDSEHNPVETASDYRLSDEAAYVLSRAQSLQDGGGTWGHAYDQAYLIARHYFPADFPAVEVTEED